jgi:ABC-2 type transport system ATP-binding protein
MPILSPGASGAEAVEVRDLVKAYQGGTRAVDGISLTVRRGEIFGFLGPNGPARRP